jgi:hypothetical protein
MIVPFLIVGLFAQPQLPFTLLASGQASGIEDAREVVVSSEQEWTALWKSHAGGEKPKKVDFSKVTVVGVFLGSRPTAGFEVRISRVVAEGRECVVEYEELRPARDRVVAQVLTSPYQLITLERPVGPVRFRKIAAR